MLEENEGDALSQAVKETLEGLKSGRGGGQAGMSEDDIMKKFSEQLQGLDEDPAMEGVMEGMMQQLLSKEFLYEPLSEIAAKYPVWLDANADGLPADEENRYR
ncbi:Pex19 protein [Baffinella frigidus]|nr:Pex19 protein [Cryptophyta sp. CCMP2293]